MSILNLQARPTITFDAADRGHREHYANFLRQRSWRTCPVQFYLEKGYGDLSAMIENKLTAYYLEQEIGVTIPLRSDQWATG